MSHERESQHIKTGARNFSAACTTFVVCTAQDFEGTDEISSAKFYSP